MEFHGFHGEITNFTEMAKKHQISRTRDTVK